MSVLHKGLLVSLIQMAIVGLVGAKFYVDRARLPRVWVQTVPIDPDLPFRGRYVRLFVAVEHPTGSDSRDAEPYREVRLQVQGQSLVATEDPRGDHVIAWRDCGARRCWVLNEPLAYFIPEHIPDPAVRQQGEELWVQVSVPKRGAPRPLRLGVKSRGKLQPLAVR